MAKASAPPLGYPLRSAVIEDVKAAISPILPQELPHLNGPNLFGVGLMLLVHDAVFWDVTSDFLRYRQRANPLLVIELFRSRVFLFFKKTSAAC